MSWLSRKKDKALTVVDEVQKRVGDQGPAWSEQVEGGVHDIEDMLGKRFAKLSGLVSPTAAVNPMRTPVVAQQARQASRAGRFPGAATANSLKPPGAALSKSVINPNRSVSSAMRTGR